MLTFYMIECHCVLLSIIPEVPQLWESVLRIRPCPPLWQVIRPCDLVRSPTIDSIGPDILDLWNAPQGAVG
jgi:hypothetical protein